MNKNTKPNKELVKTEVSSRLSISEIKERLDNCIDLYTDLFCKKQEVYANGWIGYIKGGINCFADAFLSFDDIRTDLELDAPKGLIFAWYWDNVENQGKEINYYSYIKGLRISDIKRIDTALLVLVERKLLKANRPPSLCLMFSNSLACMP